MLEMKIVSVTNRYQRYHRAIDTVSVILNEILLLLQSFIVSILFREWIQGLGHESGCDI
jgi:hypothetical protein